MHSFTGCDTVSAFAGKGKTNALKLLTTSRNIQHMFFKLGEEWDLSPELMNKLEAFTCLLYAAKGASVKVNYLRYNLFCAKKGGTAWRNTHKEPTTKQEYGKDVWSKIRKCQALLAEGGRLRGKKELSSW